MTRRVGALVLAAMCASGVADAGVPGYMFSKAGVSREAYVADVSQCSELAGGVDYRRQAAGGASMPVTYPNTNAGAAGAALGLILVALLSGNPARRTAELVERTCMADKGYIRIKVDPALRRDIEREKDPAIRVDRFFAFAAANHRGETVMVE